MINTILNVAKNDSNIRAVCLCGSRIDPHATHDDFSDYDIIYIVHDVATLLKDSSWLEAFGKRIITQTPNDWHDQPYDYTSNQPFVYLMQFEHTRIDLTITTLEDLDLTEPRDILYNQDCVGLDDLKVGDTYVTKRPSSKKVADCYNEFFWISLNVTKGLARQEIIYSQMMFTHHQLPMYYQMLDYKIGVESQFCAQTGKYYKYFKRYLTESQMKDVAQLNEQLSLDHLLDVCETFLSLSQTVGSALQYDLPYHEGKAVIEYIKKIKSEA